MAHAISIPRLGWSMEEGTFREWLKASGDKVSPGEMLYVLEGDKAAQEIESIDAGILWIPPDAPQPNDAVQVGQVIGFLLAIGETPPNEPLAAKRSSSNAIETNKSPAAAPVVQQKKHQPVATPRARRRAGELGVDWTAVSGTGRHGRIRERDVVAAASAKPEPPASRIRQAIAQRMLAGAQQTAPVTLFTKTNASELVRWRNHARENTQGAVVPGYTEIIVKLVAALLPECPPLNACWQEDQVHLHEAIHIAVAVDTDHGLLAPVLAHADRLSLQELTVQFRLLIERARAGTLSQKELQGGTFTVTNLGAFGIDFFTPIINVPQAAILGIGRIVREPVVRGEAIVVGETIGLSLTFDHRAIDGAPAARWLQRLCQAIGRPGEMLDRMR
ncbi:MAG: 2-oxo acid dehydrogenase subunit E2 [Planctomycetes bacterium]|nr:2-oxo acid dehydrogenase subunit E2 [Planctomycetota bacterium]